MTTQRAPWRKAFESYTCTACGAKPGESCTTASGNPAGTPHSARHDATGRCARCWELLPHDLDDGTTLCRKCTLIRDLEVERATKHQRREP